MYTSGTSIIKNLIASTTKGLLIASALLVGVGFSLAQENTSEASNTESSCTSCIQTPIPLDQYRQNILSIINILNTTQSAYQERSSNIAVRAWQNSRESLKIFLKNTAAVGILITKNVGETTENIALISHIITDNDIIARDIQLIQDLDTIINDKILEVAETIGAQTTISSTQHEALQQIASTYPDSMIINISQDASYGDILNTLVDLQWAIKIFIASGKKSHLTQINTVTDTEHEKLFHGGTAVTAYIPLQSIEKIITDYTCARGVSNQCNRDANSTFKDLATITTNLAKGSVNSIGQFKTSVTKLKTFFASRGKSKAISQEEEEKILAYQQQIKNGLSGYRGPFVGQERTSLSDYLKFSGPSRREMIPPLATQHEAATKETNNKDNTNDKETEDKNTDNEEKEFLKHIQELTYNATVNQNHEGQLKDLQAIRNNNIASIKQETTQINQISIVSNVSDITSLTPIILFQLHNIETIIGTPTDKNTLAENFVKACNGQCTNAGGTCRIN